MFTGIVEQVGRVLEVRSHGSGKELVIGAGFVPELRVDQSISHNGVCLTVTGLHEEAYTVVVVKETLERSDLGSLRPGDPVNLERSLRLGDRIDGHLVQGHVDAVTECLEILDENGSWRFTFKMPRQRHLLVQKGSICIHGVSLTIAALADDRFSVAIIPYTYAHTTFGSLKAGDVVNLEFDVLGKYVERMLSSRSLPDEPLPH